MNQVLKDAIRSQVPLEVYLRSSEYEPDGEYVDGEIQERPAGEIDHADWQRATLKWFLLHEDKWRTFAFPELRVQVSPRRFRVPDITVIDQSLRPQIDRYLTQPPLAVFEILSSEDSMVRVMEKLEEYSAMGIEQIWLINPGDGAISQYREHSLVPNERFRAAGKRIDFSFDTIRTHLPKPPR
jgi:Uma2 family endonuclease